MKNKFIGSKFYKREKRTLRKYELEDEVYDFLVEASEVYHASISDIMNACLDELIHTKKFKLYQHKDVIYPTHTFYITESNAAGLSELKREARMTITNLVNMAVKNIMEQNGD